MLKITMSSKGQVAIPKVLRDRLDWRQGSQLSVAVQGRGLVLEKTAKRDWRRWAGRFPKSGMLEALEREHREEVRRDSKGP